MKTSLPVSSSRDDAPLRFGAAAALFALIMLGAGAMLYQWGASQAATGASAEMLTMLLVIAALGSWVIVLLVRARQQGLALKRLERERDRLFHFSLDLLAVLGQDGKVLRCNAAFPRVLGYTERMLQGKSLIDLVHRDDLAETMSALRRLSSGEAVEFVARVRDITGEYRWLSWRINPVADENASYAIAHDITQAKQTEQALQAEMAFRRAMEESLVTGLRAIDLQGHIIYVNPAFCRLVGFTEEELLGCGPPFPYWPEESLETCWESLRMTLSGRFPAEGFDMRIRRKDGERLDVRFYLSPLIDGEGRHTGWMAAVTDVTEARRVRAALEAAQRRFAAVLEGLDAAVFVADWESDEILFANRAFKRIYGFDAVGQRAAALGVPRPISPEPEGAHPDAEKLPRELFDGEVQHPESGRWYHVHEQLTRWVDGRIVRMAIATDITVHQHLRALELQRQAQLQQTARLITMGEMASTLAHELNQPLAAIANYCRGGMSRLEQGRLDEAAVRAVLEKAATQAERAGSILNRIRDFVRKSEPRREAVPLAAIVEGAVEIMTPEAKRHNVRLMVEIPEALPPVRADQILIEQVLVNLIRNGIEAMARTRPAARQIRVQAARLDERHVAVAVIDRGRGLSPEEREQIFTSFFTTKPDGLGMGLKICRSIVEFHEGRLMVEDNPQGGGTVFRFTLPLEEC
ncbi:PAS domain-containing sensor histidine kinase [Tepidiphilus baoligensis]|nr:PAS domain S-box protein [Tepidiphilus baoligensis]